MSNAYLSEEASLGPRQRLSRLARREMLIETALEILREEGADALSLVTLADRAGVSKPIAYDHFETRSGLLIALYKRAHQQQVDALHKAVGETKPALQELSAMIASTYMQCSVALGPSVLALHAALKGSPEMERTQNELQEEQISLLSSLLLPHTSLTPRLLQLLCTALIDGAEAIARDMFKQRCTEDEAIAMFAHVLVQTTKPMNA